jgi:hypothetical protein
VEEKYSGSRGCISERRRHEPAVSMKPISVFCLDSLTLMPKVLYRRLFPIGQSSFYDGGSKLCCRLNIVWWEVRTRISKKETSNGLYMSIPNPGAKLCRNKGSGDRSSQFL